MKLSKAIGVIGDIHQEDVRLLAALEFLAERKVERVLAVGDIVDGPGDAGRCCELLREHQVEAVRGNHDRWLLEDSTPGDETVRSYLASLPATRSYETPVGRMLLCHGLGDNDMNRLTPYDYGYALETNDELQALLSTREYRYVLGGHTHRRMVKDFGGVTVINAGTLLGEHDPCFVYVDFSDKRVTFFAIADDGQISEAARHSL